MQSPAPSKFDQSEDLAKVLFAGGSSDCSHMSACQTLLSVAKLTSSHQVGQRPPVQATPG
eukprot:2734729-Alexandrium_andersonii.AAC.1